MPFNSGLRGIMVLQKCFFLKKFSTKNCLIGIFDVCVVCYCVCILDIKCDLEGNIFRVSYYRLENSFNFFIVSGTGLRNSLNSSGLRILG